MPQDLGQIATATAEDKEITAMGVALETFLNLQGQPLHAPSHVGVPRRDPNPTARWNRDQDRNAFNVAAIIADCALAPIRIRAFFNSTRITPASGQAAGAGIDAGCSTTTEAKPGGVARLRASRRHL